MSSARVGAPDRGPDRGSGTVLGVGAILLLLSLLAAFLLLAAAVQGSLRARAAADAAALAGAAVLLEGGDVRAACGEATELAAANGARLTECTRVTGGHGVAAAVRVEVQVPVPALDGAVATAVARAGAVSP